MEEQQNVEVVDHGKLVGTLITNDLCGNENTSYLVMKAYQRMQLLHNVAKFSTEKKLFKIHIHIIHKTYPGANSCCMAGSLSQENIYGLERIKKVSIKIIMGKIHLNIKHL